VITGVAWTSSGDVSQPFRALSEGFARGVVFTLNRLTVINNHQSVMELDFSSKLSLIWIYIVVQPAGRSLGGAYVGCSGSTIG